MKKIIIFFLFILAKLTFSEIEIKIFEPIRFQSILTKEKNKNEVIGIGILEISTDNLKDDKNKKIKFYFPKKGLLTNRKKWIEIKKYYLETKNNEFEILKKIEHVKVFAILERNEISKYDEVETIEGEYVGYIPIIISQYGKLKNIKEE